MSLSQSSATQIRCVVQLKSQYNLRLIDYNKYIQTRGLQNMTNIQTVTSTAFGRQLQYVVDDNYAQAIKLVCDDIEVKESKEL